MRQRLPKPLHPALHELVLFADGELPWLARTRMRAHLAGCPQCRQRLKQMGDLSQDLAQAQYESAPPAADLSGPRALLRARLAEAAAISPAKRHSLRLATTLGYACALAILVAAGAMTWRQSLTHAARGARLRPDPEFTPGSTRAVSVAQLCSVDHDEVVRAVPAALQQRVFSEYGISGRPANEYEVDYLITPGLGGADDVRNLWPQPHAHTVWNSYAKDQLEDRLHGMVCNGEVSLQVAQNEIAHDWIAAYKKYFHTQQPASAALDAAVDPDALSAYDLATEAPF